MSHTVTNADRAEKAFRALSYYCQPGPPKGQEGVSDLLCDLMHYCDEQAIDFNLALQDALWNHGEEVKDEANLKSKT